MYENINMMGNLHKAICIESKSSDTVGMDTSLMPVENVDFYILESLFANQSVGETTTSSKTFLRFIISHELSDKTLLFLIFCCSQLR